MDFSKLKGEIYFKNKFIKAKNAKIHILNHSLHFATSVFEGIRVYNNKILFLDNHIYRLIESSKLMGLKLKFNFNKMVNLNKLIIKKNNIKFGYIRPLVFRSSHSMSPDTVKCETYLAIAAWKWQNLFDDQSGIKLNIGKFPKLNSKIYPISAKSSGSYQTSVISKIDSNKKKFDDCLMLDLKKNIAETSACNIFWIKNNCIFTSKEHSILNGITRQAVIEFCKLKKIKFIKGNFKINHLLNSECVFVTGTAAEIQFVKSVNRVKFKKNKIFYKLQSYYEIIKKNPPSSISKIKKYI